MTNQKLFEALERVCGFTALETDILEIIRAVEADKMPSTETIEQAAREYSEGRTNKLEENLSFIDFYNGAMWQLSQPNPHRIKVAHVRQAFDLFFNEQITYSRMVEILNEIAAGKHKERIEL